MRFFCTFLRVNCAFLSFFALGFLGGMFGGISGASAQQTVRVIYDAQTINWLEKQAAPLLKSAQIPADSVDFALIQDDAINAFVTPERTIYFHTGLFLKAQNADEVLGVLAHEIGHIKGRHHLRLSDAVARAKYAALAGGLLGIAAAAAGGGGEAAVGLALGAQAAGTSALLSHSRSQEYQADRIALNLLEENEKSAAGLLSFFDKIQGGELLFHRDVPAYLRTHPLTNERVAILREAVEKQSFSALQSADQKSFQEIQAKIFALTHSGGAVGRKFQGREDSAAIMAQSIALALQGKLPESLSLAQKLVQADPKNPYYHELVGHILQDMNQLGPAADFFETALRLEDQDPFLRLQTALAVKAAGRDPIPLLKRLAVDRPAWPVSYRQLGIAYGQKGEFLASFLALAEESRLRQDAATMGIHIQQAEKYEKNATDAQKEELKRLKEFQNALKNGK